MSQRYQPGERELQLAGAFVRYFRAFHNIIENENLDIDRESILDLAASAFFRDVDSDLELHNAVSMASLYAQVEQAGTDREVDDEGFIYESKSQEGSKKNTEPDAPDFDNTSGLGDFLSGLFDPNRINRNN